MKRCASYILYTLLLAATVCACSDYIDIIRNYGYRVETLPLPKKLVKGETVDLEFSIIHEGGYYEGTVYKFRYFQSEGKGVLTSGDSIVPVNRFQAIADDDFVLTCTSASEVRQQLDFVFEDSFGQRVEYTIKFSSDSTKEEEEEEAENGSF
jgi:hypothetical protein